MATTLIAGANTVVTQSGAPSQLNVIASWDYTEAEFFIDVNALACDTGGNVVNDSHFVFFNNASTPDGGVRLEPTTTPSATERERLSVDLGKLNAAIDRVVFAAVVYEAEENGHSFQKAKNIGIRVEDPSGAPLAIYNVEALNDLFTALLLGELYRNKGEWKFRALGQGYLGGLGALANDHGVALRG